MTTAAHATRNINDMSKVRANSLLPEEGKLRPRCPRGAYQMERERSYTFIKNIHSAGCFSRYMFGLGFRPSTKLNSSAQLCGLFFAVRSLGLVKGKTLTQYQFLPLWLEQPCKHMELAKPVGPVPKHALPGVLESLHPRHTGIPQGLQSPHAR